MKKWLVMISLLGIMMIGQDANAAQVPQLIQETEIVADNAVSPLDYSFFEEVGQGRLEFYNLKNLYGAGAGLIVYVNTDEGEDWLMMGFGGGMIETRLMKSKFAILTERFSAVTRTNPLVLTIQDGNLTVAIGNKKRVVKNVNSFTGRLTTQSIMGNLKVYQFVEQQDKNEPLIK